MDALDLMAMVDLGINEVFILQCEKKGCNHVEPHIEITKDMVGRECPECQTVLCTREDFDEYRAKNS